MADDKLPRLNKTISGNYNYIKEDGSAAFSVIYRQAGPFLPAGIAPVSVNGRDYGWITRYGAIINDFTLPGRPSGYFNGLSIVRVSGDSCYVYSIDGRKVSPGFVSLECINGIFKGARKTSGSVNIYDGKFRPVLPGDYSSIIIVKPQITVLDSTYTAIFLNTCWGREKSLVDCHGAGILGDSFECVGPLCDFVSTYDFNKQLSKCKVPESGMLTNIVIATHRDGVGYGAYLLDGTEVIPPKEKTPEKCAKSLVKNFKKKVLPLLGSGVYANSTVKALDRLSKTYSEFVAANRNELGIAEDFNPIFADIKRYFVSVKTSAATKTKAKGKSRKKRSKARRTAKAVSYKYLDGSEFGGKNKSEEFEEIIDNSIFFFCRRPGEKKYNLYNFHGQPMTFDGYDEITLWTFNKDDEPLFKVRNGKEWGIINLLGDEMLTPQYSEISYPLSDHNMAYATRDGSMYLISGNNAVPVNGIAYDDISYYTDREGMTEVKRLGYTTKIDKYGKETPSIAHMAFNQVYEKQQAGGNAEEIVKDYHDVLSLCGSNDREVKGATFCNIGFILEQNGLTDKAKEYYAQGARFGSSQAEENLKIIKRNERAARWQAVGEALNGIAQTAAGMSGNSQNGLAGFLNGLSGQGGDLGSYGSQGYDYQSDDQGSQSASKGGASESFYRDDYARWERRAKDQYESLTRAGTRTRTNGQDTSGTANGHWRHHYSQLKRLLRDSQSRMRKTRQEARRYGYNIPQSNYETVTVTN